MIYSIKNRTHNLSCLYHDRPLSKIMKTKLFAKSKSSAHNLFSQRRVILAAIKPQLAFVIATSPHLVSPPLRTILLASFAPIMGKCLTRWANCPHSVLVPCIVQASNRVEFEESRHGFLEIYINLK